MKSSSWPCNLTIEDQRFGCCDAGRTHEAAGRPVQRSRPARTGVGAQGDVVSHGVKCGVAGVGHPGRAPPVPAGWPLPAPPGWSAERAPLAPTHAPDSDLDVLGQSQRSQSAVQRAGASGSRSRPRSGRPRPGQRWPSGSRGGWRERAPPDDRRRNDDWDHHSKARLIAYQVWVQDDASRSLSPIPNGTPMSVPSSPRSMAVRPARPRDCLHHADLGRLLGHQRRHRVADQEQPRQAQERDHRTATGRVAEELLAQQSRPPAAPPAGWRSS